MAINGIFYFFFFLSLKIETLHALGHLSPPFPSHLKREQNCSFFTIAHFHPSRSHSSSQPVNSSLSYCCGFDAEGNIIALFKYLKSCGVEAADGVVSGGSKKMEHLSYAAEHWVQHPAASLKNESPRSSSKQSLDDFVREVEEEISVLEMSLDLKYNILCNIYIIVYINILIY